jgi:hypothetical protein
MTKSKRESRIAELKYDIIYHSQEAEYHTKRVKQAQNDLEKMLEGEVKNDSKISKLVTKQAK